MASHYLGGTAPSLPKTHLNGVLTASRVLLRYLLSSLDAQNANGSAAPCSLNQVSPGHEACRIVSALINFIANISSVFPISCLTLCLSSSSLVAVTDPSTCAMSLPRNHRTTQSGSQWPDGSAKGVRCQTTPILPCSYGLCGSVLVMSDMILVSVCCGIPLRSGCCL